MELIPKIPWWIKWFLKKALIWLARKAYKKLVEGLWIKVELKEDVLHIYIKLEDNPPAIAEYLHL